MKLSREQTAAAVNSSSSTSGENFTTQQAADYLRVSARTLQRWVREKKIEFVKLGRLIRFTKTALDRFMRVHAVAASRKVRPRV